MGNSFSTCNCVDYDTYEDNIRVRRMEREIKNERITELSKKKFYSIPDNDDIKDISESDDVKDISEYQRETEEIRLENPNYVGEDNIINPKSATIKHIDEIINYLQQIPTHNELP